MTTQQTRVQRNLKVNQGRIIRVEQQLGRLEKRFERLEKQNAALKPEVPKRDPKFDEQKIGQLEKQNANLKAELSKLRARVDQNTKDNKQNASTITPLLGRVTPPYDHRRMITDSGRALRSRIFPPEQRPVDGAFAVFVTLACVTLSLITLYFAFIVTIGEVRTRSLHLFFTVLLALLLYPAWRSARSWFDWALAALAAASFAWAFYRADAWLDRFVGYDDVSTVDFIFGIIALVTIFEATRRTVGVTIVVLNLLFIGYALTGPHWPGVLEHGGWASRELVEMLYLDAEGIFNFVTGIMATYLFTFLLFGVFLRATGGDTVFIDMAAAVAGHRRGGAAKVAVVSSAFMGMLSGSSISNVSTTGTMTIPMMKRLGFRDYEAAAVETVASVGGGLMPPLMGTGVFIMASLTNIPLIDILLYSIAPGILYFTALYFYADIRASQRGVAIVPKEELPNLYRSAAPPTMGSARKAATRSGPSSTIAPSSSSSARAPYASAVSSGR